jgi:hypothetical protein
MAVIGHAEVIVKAITTGFEDSIRNDLKRISGSNVGRAAGQSLGQSFSDGFKRSTSGNVFGKFSDGLRQMAPEAENARKKFQSLVRIGYVVQGVLGLLVGGVAALAVSLGTLVGVLGKAAPAVAVLSAALVTLKVAQSAAKFGFGDIASAVKQATSPTTALGKSIAELREEFQQLQFAAEGAALGEERAALNLEAAVENLRRTADLPPNSAARREAMLAREEAELAYREAKDRTQDLNAEVEKGVKGLDKGTGGTDPFADLNEAQKEFAQYLVTLAPLIEALELDVSKALLPPLKNAVEILRKELLPILQRRLPQVAGQVGDALESMVDSIDFELIDKIFAGMTEPFEKEGRSNIQLFGELLGNVLDIFLRITDATSLLLNDFLVFLVEKTDEWITSLTDGDLEGFFADAGVYAGRLGTIIGNVFTGLGNLIGLTTGPGSAGNDMLTWMEEATGTFATMFSEDPEAGKTFFKDAFANARSVMSSIGALLMEILKLADNPNIKIAFDQLKEGAPALGEMLGKMIDAGPSFATFLSTVTEIVNKLTDDNQISAFFDTLNEGASAFNDFLDGDIAKRLLDNLGPIFATLSALGVMFDVVRFGFNVLVGYLIFTTDIFSAGFTKIGTFLGTIMGKKGIGGIMKLLKGPGLIGLFIVLVGKAVEFYNTIESFKEMVDNVFGRVKESFDRLMEGVSELFGKIFGEGDGSLLGALDPVIQIILEILIPALGYAIEQILSAMTFIIDFANSLLDVVIPIVTRIADAIGMLFEGDVIGFVTKMMEAFGVFLVGLMQLVVNGIIDLVNFGIRGVNNLIGMITNGPLGDFMRDVFDVDLSGVQISEIRNVDMLGQIQRGQDRKQRDETNKAIQSSANGFGGADRRAMSSMGTSSMSSKVTDSAVYKEYAAKQDVQVNIYGTNLTKKELGDEVGRQIARQALRGTI